MNYVKIPSEIEGIIHGRFEYMHIKFNQSQIINAYQYKDSIKKKLIKNEKVLMYI